MSAGVRDPLAGPLHRGSVAAVAVLVDERWLGAAGACARVLAAWTPGASVRRVADGWLVTWPEPRRLGTDAAPGLPLCAGPGGTLLGAPLAAEALGGAGAGAGSVVLVRGGRVVVETPGPAVDLATWLDLGDLPVADVEPLAAAPVAPPVAPRPPAPREARTILGGGLGIGAPSAENEAVREALAAAGKGRAPTRDPAKPGGRGPSGFGQSVLVTTLVMAGVAAFLALMVTAAWPALFLLAGAAQGLNAVATARRRSGSTRAGGPPRPARTTWRSRLGAWLGGRIARSPVGPWLARKQARYLAKMIELFEKGDLEAALRHGIPIGGDGGPGSVALTAPTPRTSIGVSPWTGAGAGGTIDVGGWLAGIRALYRQAFERLEREGRLDEAAFVIAELLRENAEAVAFLERHGRLRLAAELAEARGLPPGEAVRLWLLAGDPARALALAHQRGAFADAIARLERGHPEAARGLRLAWADALASRGDFLAAAEVLAREASAAPLVRTWLDAARRLGGLNGARALVRQVEVFPGDFAQVRDHVLAVCAERDGQAARRHLAAAFVETHGRARAELKALARPLARAVLRDGEVGARDGASLVALAGAELAADLPPAKAFPAPPPALVGRSGVVHELEANDSGNLPVLSAVLLPSGRILAALGDAGVLLLDVGGRVVHHFDQPCAVLVPAAAGHLVLALAPRGPDVWRVARLDLVRATATPWCTLRAAAFALEHDGAQWIVSDGDSVRALDVLAAAPRAIWERDRLGAIRRVSTSVADRRLGVLSSEGAWGYELPAGSEPVLRSRTQALLYLGEERLLADNDVSASGAIIDLAMRVPPGGGTTARASLSVCLERNRDMALAQDRLVRLCAGPQWIATWGASALEELRTDVTVCTQKPIVERATIRLHGVDPGAVHVRLQPDALVVCDDRGRVVAMSLDTGELVAHTRVRWP